MMEELWQSWSHLGVDDQTKISYITELVPIEKEFHRDVISETRQKIKAMEETISSEFLCFLLCVPFVMDITCNFDTNIIYVITTRLNPESV